MKASLNSGLVGSPFRVLPVVIFAMLLALIAPKRSNAADLQVFAAASLTDVLTELGPQFQAATGHTAIYNFAASSVLARQIQEGAPADVFFSADEVKMDQLAAKGLVVPASRKSILGNSLVIVVASENGAAVASPKELLQPSVKLVALGEPATVPAGVYAKEYFQKIGIWTELEPKVLPSENVRASLAAVESGNAQAGVVYKTDAQVSKKVKVAYEVPAADGPKISYPVAILRDSKQAEAAKQFLEFLGSSAAKQAFRRYGFTVTDPTTP